MEPRGTPITLLPCGPCKSMDWPHVNRNNLKVLARKFTALLLLAACLEVSGRALPQGKVTIMVKDASLKDVLQDIGKQAGYNYFFVDQWAALAKKITMNVKDVSINIALDLC